MHAHRDKHPMEVVAQVDASRMLAVNGNEAQEGRDAFLEKRSPDFTKFPWHF